MKNAFRVFSKSELAGMNLDNMLDELIAITGAGFIQLFFDPVAGKKFAGNVHRFNTNAGLTEAVKRGIRNLSLELAEDQPVIHISRTGLQFEKQQGLNLEPFQQLVCIPIKEGPREIVLKLGFLEEVNNADELIIDLQACGDHIIGAINQYKLERSDKERKFLLAFSAAVSSIKNKTQLSKAINYHLKNYLDFTYATLFVLNNEGDTVVNYFNDPEARGNGSPFREHISVAKYPVSDPGAGEDLAAAFNFHEISETHDVLPYLHHHHAGTNGLVVNLRPEDDVIAHLALVFERKYPPDQDILMIIANLLSTAFAKLQAEELSAEREAESELLQSLNIDFASIKDKKDLLKIIHYKLKKLFDFGHHWVAVLNEDQLTMTSFLQDPMSNAKDHPKYRQMLTARYTTNDRVFNKVLLSKDAHVFDLDQLNARASMPEYMAILYESGIRKVAMIGLQVGARIIGVWAICLTADQAMTDRQLNLIKTISNQLSIAVDNIIAGLAVMEKEAEREKLLEFSFSLTSIRNRSHLLRAVRNNLKKIVSFGELVILVSNENVPGSSIFLNTMELPDDVETPEAQKTRNSYFERIFESGDLVVFNNQNIRSDCSTNMVGLGLKENSYNIGLFFMYVNTGQTYTDHDLELIKGIAYQLSPAVANVLANEDIQNREKEKELLLALNTDITAVRYPEEVFRVITRRLKNFIGFSHMLISKIDKDKLTVSAFLIDELTSNMEEPAFQQSLESYPIADIVFGEVLQRSRPAVFDLVRMQSHGTLPAYLQAGFENGAQQVVIARLAKGVEVYGCWFLFFDDTLPIANSKLELLESMANQISIAMANMTANQEIARREQEKARLLSFSNAIASVRDKHILARILKQQLKEIFDIKDYIIHYLSDDKQKHMPVLFDPDAGFANYPDFKKLLNNWNDVNDGIFNKILAVDEPVFFDIDECFNQPGSPGYLKTAKAINLQQMIGVSIRLGQENIAVMNFIHHDYARVIEQYHLFKCILSQIALGISNMMANEKVSRQLEEINNYRHQLEEEKIYLKEEIETTLNYAEIVGESPLMQKVFRLVAQVAPSDSTVLLLGETGTGKELIARAIHNNSPRKNKLMVKVNCAALPVNLIESELFGHERGSFTGATERRLGKFELANNGTLFLDEIGEMPLDLQVKLLRALQEREIERVGGNATIKVNVRVIAATNRDLEKEMQEGRFRKDLYYRLNIFPIELPPLRDRKEDIPLLAIYFIQRFAKKAGKDILTLTNRALQELVQYKWPGNIRELEHLIERSVLLAPGDTIKQVHLPAAQQQPAITAEPEFVIKTIDEHERDAILKTLSYCSGRIGGSGGAAMLLGLPTSTLNSRMKRLGIRKEHISR